MQTKQCARCKEIKERDQFNKDNQASNGIRSNCRQCEVFIRKEQYLKNRVKRIADSKKWRSANKQKANDYLLSWRNKNKQAFLDKYGNKCVCCGETEYIFLTLDHINGGGNKHRKELKLNATRMYQYAVKNYNPKQFQILCMNCQYGTRFGKICPHQSRKQLTTKNKEKTMKTYRINYANGLEDIVRAENALELVKRYDLATKENIKTKVTELEKTYIGDVEAFEMIIGTVDNLPKVGQELMLTATYENMILGKDEAGYYISNI